MTLPAPVSPKVLHAGEGEYVTIGKGTICTFKVTGKETNGQFGLFEYSMDPATPGPAPHIHRNMTEIFYVVAGEVEFQVGVQKIIGRPGTLALIPKETVHAFNNHRSQRSVLLIMFCPADSREKYFEGLAELTKGERKPDKQELLDLMRRFDQEPVVEL